MQIRSFVLLLALLASPAAAESVEKKVGEAFASAFARGDTAQQAQLASEHASKVAYPLVVEWLLFTNQEKAAESLAKLRAKQGPEGPGLKAIVEAWKGGMFPGREQMLALQNAEGALRGRNPAAALSFAKQAGEPMPGTPFGVRLTWARARALERLKRADEARAELALCAGLARKVCWFAMQRDAEEARVARATSLSDALEAADGFLEAAHVLGDGKTRLKALNLRASYRAREAQRLRAAGEKDAAAAMSRLARQDYRDLIALAERENQQRALALAWRDLALFFQVYEGQPRQAIKYYENAVKILRAMPQPVHLDDTLFNLATALTSVARYDDALETLGELLRRGDRLKTSALAQRAYILTRQGRVETGAKAYAAAIGAAIASEAPSDDQSRLHVEAGNLQVQRGDLRAAEKHFRRALNLAPDSPAAWVGQARVRGLGGHEQGSLGAFAEALRREKDPSQKAMWLILRAAQQRSWGRLDDARASAAEALKILVDADLREFANAGAAWHVLGDLTLLSDGVGDDEERYAKGAGMLANAGTLFFRLKDPYRAIDLYAQETLVLVMLKRMTDALHRLQTLLKLAETTPSDALKSTAKATEAIFEAREGRLGNALVRLDEAVKLAAAAGDRLRHATALTNRVLVDPASGASDVVRALELLDARRLDGPEDHPLIDGYRPDRACSIGLAAILAAEKPDVEQAFALIERSRGERLLVAMRGRNAVLEAALPQPMHGRYVDAVSRLMEARAVNEGVDDAEKAYDEVVSTFLRDMPQLGGIAWPRAPALREVQAALRTDEALLVMHVDAYAQAMMLIDSGQAVLLPWDPEKKFAPLEKLLATKKRVLFAPHGNFLRVPLELWPFQGKTFEDFFEIYYVSSGASFLRQRRRRVEPGRGTWAVGPAPVRFGKPMETLPGSRKAIIHVGLPAVFDNVHPQATRIDTSALGILKRRYRADTLVVPDAQTVAGARFEGVGALVEALQYVDAGGVVLSVLGAPSAEQLDYFYAACLDEKLEPAAAVRKARAWAKSRANGDPAKWAGLIYWGVP